MAALDDNLRKAEAYLARFRRTACSTRSAARPCRPPTARPIETISPIDLKPLARVARGKAADIDRAAKAAKAAFRDWAAMSGDARKKLLHKIADAIVARAEEIAFVECMDTGQSLKFMAKAALRGAENFRFFADRAPEARDGQALRGAGPGQHHDARADRPGRRHHAVEHAVHAVDLEDRAGARRRLHDRPQAGRVVAADGAAAGRDRRGGRPAEGRVEPRQRFWRGRRQGADRTSRHQGDRLRRRKPHRLDDHEAGRRHAEARAFRARRQEPGDRLCRRRSGARGGRRRLHDLLAERRALHLVLAPAGRGKRLRQVHRAWSPRRPSASRSAIRSIPKP